MLDTFIAVFKFVTLVATGVFGIYGLHVKFQEENGRITKAGRWVRFLIVISTPNLSRVSAPGKRRSQKGGCQSIEGERGECLAGPYRRQVREWTLPAVRLRLRDSPISRKGARRSLRLRTSEAAAFAGFSALHFSHSFRGFIG